MQTTNSQFGFLSVMTYQLFHLSCVISMRWSLYSKQFSLIGNVIFLGYVFIIVIKGHFCFPSLSFLVAISLTVYVPGRARKHTHTYIHPRILSYQLHLIMLAYSLSSNRVLFLSVELPFYSDSVFMMRPNHSILDACSLLQKIFLQLSRCLLQFSFFCLDYHILRNLISAACFQILYLMTVFQICLL